MWVDLLDSLNQKFDPGASGMTSTNAQDGIIEAYNNAGGGGIPEPVDDTYGYLREGPTNQQWVRGARVFEGPTEPVDWAVGDFWIET